MNKISRFRHIADTLTTEFGVGRVPVIFRSIEKEIMTHPITGEQIQGIRFGNTDFIGASSNAPIPILITINSTVFDDMSDLGFTYVLLHEIAHVRKGYHAGHGPVWQEDMVRLGLATDEFVTRDSVLVEPETLFLDTRWHERLNSDLLSINS